jgi:hypothetical protein
MIVAYTGLTGTCKTYSMTRDAQIYFKRKRNVYANFPLKGAWLYKSLADVVDVRDGLIIFDELNMEAPAWQPWSLPAEYLQLWSQHRKSGVDFWWSAQSFHSVNANVRALTGALWEFETWLQPRYDGSLLLPIYRGYKLDPVGVERGLRHPKCLARKWIWAHRGVFKLYDSYARVEVAEYLHANYKKKRSKMTLLTDDLFKKMKTCNNGGVDAPSKKPK